MTLEQLSAELILPILIGKTPEEQRAILLALRKESGLRAQVWIDKCRVMMAIWTAGKGTDIRLRDPACRSWEPKIDKIELLTTCNRSRRVLTLRQGHCTRTP